MKKEEGGVKLIVTGFVVLLLAIMLGVYFLVFATAGVRGKVALHNQVRSPEQQQLNYEKFHDECHAVLAMNGQIKTIQASLTSMQEHMPANDPFGQYQQSIAQKQTDLDGVKNQRDQVAQEYNSASHEALTRAFMKSHDLPEEIGPPNGTYDQLVCETNSAPGRTS